MNGLREKGWPRIIAESVAIVGSILIAFAIDAWYESAQEQELAEQYTQRLVDELEDILTQLENLDRALSRAIEYGATVEAFFDGVVKPIDYDRVVVAAYNMGRDSLWAFDQSTYEDLISTGRLGLLADVEQRESVQRAYRELQALLPVQRPFRDEYLAGIRGWIPRRVVDQIREVCVRMDSPDWICPDVDLDDEVVQSIIGYISTDEALLSFRLREQGLGYAIDFTGVTRNAVEVALENLR